MEAKNRQKALLRIPYGVHVVGVRSGTDLNAFTVTWLSQCSFRPPRLMMGVRVGSEGHEMIAAGRAFAVSFLASGQQEIARTFFRRAVVEEGRLSGYAFRAGETGCPLLEEAPAFAECRVVDLIEAGDHAIVVGEVVAAGATGDDPSLTLAETGWSYKG